MLYIFEMLLCFWAWLKKDEYWHRGDEQSLADAKHAIATLLSETIVHFDRSSGQGWSIPKFHELLHIANNIRLWGSHQNIHSGPQEHNHIANIKQPARRTQKIKTKFDYQVANRVYERNLTNHVSALINGMEMGITNSNLTESTPHDAYSPSIDISIPSQNGATCQASKYVVFIIRKPNNTVETSVNWISPSKATTKLSLELQKSLRSLFFDPLPLHKQRHGLTLNGYTEYNRKGLVFRAHPNYRQEGPWYDYAMITWDLDMSEDSSSGVSNGYATDNSYNNCRTILVPAKILGFVSVQYDDTLQVIIHSCYEQKQKESVLTRRWRFEFEEDKLSTGASIFSNVPTPDDASYKNPLIRKVEVDCIERHCLMLPYHASSHFLLELIPQYAWADEFSEV